MGILFSPRARQLLISGYAIPLRPSQALKHGLPPRTDRAPSTRSVHWIVANQAERVCEFSAQNLSQSEIARRLGIGRTSVRRIYLG